MNVFRLTASDENQAYIGLIRILCQNWMVTQGDSKEVISALTSSLLEAVSRPGCRILAAPKWGLWMWSDP